MVAAGALCRPPTGGFYLYPDFEPLRATVRRRGVTDSASLQRVLLDDFGVAVLGSHHLGDDASALRFRAATSMLYGHSEEERAAALSAEQPTMLPHIRNELAMLGEAMEKFAS